MLYIDEVYVNCYDMYIGSLRMYFFYCLHLIHLIKKPSTPWHCVIFLKLVEFTLSLCYERLSSQKRGHFRGFGQIRAYL